MGPLLALSSSPPPRLDNSPSNMSSPLSDVEDKDADHEEMELRMRLHAPDRLGTPKRNSHGADEDSDVDEESDDESKLSEMDINDSEAETERLYDTPQKEKTTRDVLGVRGGVGSRQFVDRRDRVFERSPSKLQQQLQAELDAENGASDNESLSEADEEEDDDELSRASSEAQPDPKPTKDRPRRSPSQPKKKPEPIASAASSNSNLTSQESQDSRKRKRSSVAGQSEQEQPLRKRTGSIGVPEGDFSADDAVIADDEGGVSTNPQSGTHTGEEDNIDPPVVPKNKEDPVASVEDDVIDTPRSRKSRRGSAKRRKSKSPERSGGQGAEEAHIDPPDDGDDPAPEDAVDEHAADADEEAEAAHRNEEELERKKAAWEELTAIEKQFSNFRERLHQERLAQLNQEEAMLTSENPSHPEYLAMLKCIEERRDEKVRLSAVEMQLELAVLRDRAVGERSQIMSQFYQGVREAREKVLEELGQQWYEIQQERRRLANTIPDYGIRFPTSKPLAVKQAVAYNKEVSVLSGFAKHVGFPAAPVIHGVTEEELENDWEAMRFQRVAEPAPPPQQNHQPPFHAEFAGGMPFGRLLGPAGEQFIEQTPWANPNHPSHQAYQAQQRQNSHQEGPVQAVFAPGPRRHSHQLGGMFSSSTTTVLNGDSPGAVQKAHSSGGPDTIKAAKMLAEQANKRDTVAPA